MTALNVMGALTPRKAIDLANETLQVKIPQYPEETEEGWFEWMDQPMPLTQATSKSQQTGEGKTTQAAQKSKDGAVKGTEASGETMPKAPEHGQE
jgi:hypothetical protein